MRRSARHVLTSLQSNPSLIDSHGYACDVLTPHALGVWRGDEVGSGEDTESGRMLDMPP